MSIKLCLYSYDEMQFTNKKEQTTHIQNYTEKLKNIRLKMLIQMMTMHFIYMFQNRHNYSVVTDMRSSFVFNRGRH